MCAVGIFFCFIKYFCFVLLLCVCVCVCCVCVCVLCVVGVIGAREVGN
jgi:hypothetical protein